MNWILSNYNPNELNHEKVNHFIRYLGHFRIWKYLRSRITFWCQSRSEFRQLHWGRFVRLWIWKHHQFPWWRIRWIWFVQIIFNPTRAFVFHRGLKTEGNRWRHKQQIGISLYTRYGTLLFDSRSIVTGTWAPSILFIEWKGKCQHFWLRNLRFCTGGWTDLSNYRALVHSRAIQSWVDRGETGRGCQKFHHPTFRWVSVLNLYLIPFIKSSSTGDFCFLFQIKKFEFTTLWILLDWNISKNLNFFSISMHWSLFLTFIHSFVYLGIYWISKLLILSKRDVRKKTL